MEEHGNLHLLPGTVEKRPIQKSVDDSKNWSEHPTWLIAYCDTRITLHEQHLGFFVFEIASQEVLSNNLQSNEGVESSIKQSNNLAILDQTSYLSFNWANQNPR